MSRPRPEHGPPGPRCGRSRTGESYRRIYEVVRRIPKGKVATYGQVARLAGLPGHARQVGYALHALPEASGVPWQRVVNAQGGVSPRSEPGYEEVQRELLEREKIIFGANGRISLARYQWREPSPRALEATLRRPSSAGRFP